MDTDDRFLSLLPRLKRVVRRECFKRKLSKEECEDLLGQVSLRLWENDQRAWKQWWTAGQKSSYLVRLVRNLAVDTCRAETGRRRHSKAAVRAGYWGMRLEQIHAWDRQGLETSIRILQENEGCPLSTTALRELAQWLRLQPVTSFVEEEALAQLPTSDPAADSAGQYQRRELACRIANAVNRGIASVEDPADRVLVRAVFYKGLTVTSVARSLGLPRRRAYSRLEKVCRRTLRAAFRREGLAAEEVLAALAEGLPELAVDWHRLEEAAPDRGNVESVSGTTQRFVQTSELGKQTE